jgi:hypothetical protein
LFSQLPDLANKTTNHKTHFFKVVDLLLKFLYSLFFLLLLLLLILFLPQVLLLLLFFFFFFFFYYYYTTTTCCSSSTSCWLVVFVVLCLLVVCGVAYDHHVGLLEQTRRTRGAAPTAPTVATG